MNNQYTEKFDELTLRERGLVVATVLIAIVFAWWFLFAEPELKAIKDLEGRNDALRSEVKSLNQTATIIKTRIDQGVFKKEQQQLALLNEELKKLNQALSEKTDDLIDPNDMFNLMQQMIFKESKLKLTKLKRKSVNSIFKSGEDEDQPQIYRHVMQIGFQGAYQDILKYVSTLENLDWKLVWDRISLKSDDSPKVKVDVNVEISTLSESQAWVGL